VRAQIKRVPPRHLSRDILGEEESALDKSGEFATVAELAEREGIAPSYMTRVLRLTLLAAAL
jgi:hypothetical protein